MKSETFSPVESIKLIEQMIKESNRSFERNSERPYLIWGYTSLLVSLAVYFLLPLWGAKALYLWFIIPIVGWVLMFLTGSMRLRSEVQSHVGRFISILWAVVGINFFPLSLLMPGEHILSSVLVFGGVGSVITALILRNTVLSVTSAIGVVLGYVMAFVDLGRDEILLFALGIVIIFIVPGHYLQTKNKRHGA